MHPRARQGKRRRLQGHLHDRHLNGPKNRLRAQDIHKIVDAFTNRRRWRWRKSATQLEQRRDKTRALKQGMMQELLTGRVRLR